MELTPRLWSGVMGSLSRLASAEPIVAVVRGEHLIRFDDDRVATLQAGDRLICLSPAKETP